MKTQDCNIISERVIVYFPLYFINQHQPVGKWLWWLLWKWTLWNVKHIELKKTLEGTRKPILNRKQGVKKPLHLFKCRCTFNTKNYKCTYYSEMVSKFYLEGPFVISVIISVITGDTTTMALCQTKLNLEK